MGALTRAQVREMAIFLEPQTLYYQRRELIQVWTEIYTKSQEHFETEFGHLHSYLHQKVIKIKSTEDNIVLFLVSMNSD